MAYGGFAYVYDELNSGADYDTLTEEILALLRRHGIQDGIVADLGCGTGEMTLRLARACYDMIAIDASADMLQVLREKMDNNPQQDKDILLLCQQLQELDLYGTIRAAIATFDTLNHLTPAQLKTAIARVSLFMEPGGLLIFDINTLHKHRDVLGNYTFELASPNGLACVWDNSFDAATGDVGIELTITPPGQNSFSEAFREYYHKPDALTALLSQNGLDMIRQMDGELFGAITPQTQRILMAAQKR